ncbi:heat stress transcription factor B-4-like [Cucurbita pepo subsp. pepo]|uniref:Heat stress transcription factor B-4-like n=1 Tax=Cucurbita moschata TaxID=3662 RepID=A0A6J1FJH2_CUCMO|nr:heat stress transcription factor B-4-like [Cucurbita moschata]XP_023525267.1 heat stress transcription factor B-4-like [Cucurbita pepo subsp. pepo]
MALMLDNCEGVLLSLDSHKAIPAPFLTKTYQLVDDPTTDHIVSWGEDDTTFVVWRPPEFARDLLPNYFKHNNFSSFVRQLNTYGFRKIVPDRWEFANEFFRKGEKHLLCEIHRRKTAQPQVTVNQHHQSYSPLGLNAGFYHYPARVSISPSDSDDNPNWCDSPPLSSNNNNNNFNNSVTALSEDNERLRRSNNMLMSELAHMKKLYNDIIYFVQNHVKPVAPSNSYQYSTSLLSDGFPVGQRQPNHHLLGYHPTNAKQVSGQTHFVAGTPNNNNGSSKSFVTIVEEPKTKLFGVSLQSKKRVHPEYGSNNIVKENNKARLVLEKDDLGLNLMPPSAC